jgi:hypothetical protein
MENWKEAGDLQCLKEWLAETIEGYYATIYKKGEANCPGGEWTIVEQLNSSLTYERHN